jgi:hypothetical protein
MPNPDGTTRKIPCDRNKIGPVVWTLLKSKIEFVRPCEEKLGSLEDYRLWTALTHHFMRDLPTPEELSAYSPSTLEEFLHLYQ